MKRKKGILLIVLAIVVFAGYLGYDLDSKKEKGMESKSPNMTGTPTTFSNPEPIVTPEPSQEADVPEDAENDLQDGIELDVKDEILSYMGVLKKELANQIKIFANSVGYAEANYVQDMGEMTVNFTEETIIIPCYLSMGKQSMKFDVIYQYKKGNWRFVPW